jgi:hypothetical protein
MTRREYWRKRKLALQKACEARKALSTPAKEVQREILRRHISTLATAMPCSSCGRHPTPEVTAGSNVPVRWRYPVSFHPQDGSASRLGWILRRAGSLDTLTQYLKTCRAFCGPCRRKRIG